MGSKTHTKQSRGVILLPPPGRCVFAPWNNRVGEGDQGRGSGGGRTPGRGPADRDQGGDEGGRRQGRDRRDPEQEAHSWTQATAKMMAHGGADGGRSHGGVMAADSRGPTNGGGAGGGGPRRRRRANNPGGCRGSGGPGWSRGLWRPRRRRRSAVEPEWLRTQVELKGGRSPTEPVGRSDEVQPEERSPEAMAGRRPTKAKPEGWGSPVELVDRWVTVEVRELGAEVEPLGLRAEAESGPWRRRWGILQPRRRWRMADPRGSHCTDGGLRASGGLPDESGGGGRSGREGGHFRGAGTGGHFRGAGTGGHFRGAGTGESEAPSVLDGTSGDDGERRGGISYSSSVSQSIKSPSMSSSPRCRISSPSATVQGAELHSALTPSTAGSLVVGIVTGSRTWSDVLGSTSGAILCSVARLCAGSQIAAGNGSPSSVGSGWCSVPLGDGGLGSGSGVDLARSSTAQMNEWMMHLYSALLCIAVHPKRFTIMWGGSLLNHHHYAASTWMMRRQPQDNGASALTTHQLQVERRERSSQSSGWGLLGGHDR